MSCHRHGYPWPFLAILLYWRWHTICVKKRRIGDSVDASVQRVLETRGDLLPLSLQWNATCKLWYEKLSRSMTVLHPRDDVDRRLVSIQDNGDASIQGLVDYIEKRGGRLTTTTRKNTETIQMNRTEINRKQKGEEKRLYGRFKWLTSDISHEKKIWTWLRNGNLKWGTESLLIAMQNNAIKANHIKGITDKS